MLTPWPEQEDLIQTLAEQNNTRNHQYKMILLALPVASCIPYLIALFRAQTRLVALLGLTSLASTAFLLSTLPPIATGMAALDSWARSSGPPGARGDTDDVVGGAGGPSGLGALEGRGRRQRRRSSAFGGLAPQKSPLETYLPYLNVGLCAVLVLYGLLVRRGGGVADEPGGAHSQQFGLLGLGNLSAIVYAVVIVAKLVMASVDPERELAALKYGYKGA